MNRRKFVGAVAALGSIKEAARAQQAKRNGRASNGSLLYLEQQWGAQHYDDKEREQVLDVIARQNPFRWYGPRDAPPGRVFAFEKEFAARMQTKYALAVSSGTAALEAAVVALGIGPGDEVIMPAWTWHSSATAVIRSEQHTSEHNSPSKLGWPGGVGAGRGQPARAGGGVGRGGGGGLLYDGNNNFDRL